MHLPTVQNFPCNINNLIYPIKLHVKNKIPPHCDKRKAFSIQPPKASKIRNDFHPPFHFIIFTHWEKLTRTLEHLPARICCRQCNRAPPPFRVYISIFELLLQKPFLWFLVIHHSADNNSPPSKHTVIRSSTIIINKIWCSRNSLCQSVPTYTYIYISFIIHGFTRAFPRFSAYSVARELARTL